MQTRMTQDELQEVLDKHKKWLRREVGGQRANLKDANLMRAYLADADLAGANLTRANLKSANLKDANLTDANLTDANLTRADLAGADLADANLTGANLAGAYLTGTCLDHNATPNGNAYGFATDGEYVIGYRTRKAGHIDIYRDGRFYNADFFSVAATECHPGLYLWPTLDAAKQWSPNAELIRVRTKPSEVHKAGNKWRCRWFEVLGGVEGGAHHSTCGCASL